MDDTKEMLRDTECAELIDVSRATWWSLNARGLVPEPVRIGRSVRWRANEIRAWLDAGCPERAEWLNLRTGA